MGTSKIDDQGVGLAQRQGAASGAEPASTGLSQGSSGDLAYPVDRDQLTQLFNTVSFRSVQLPVDRMWITHEQVPRFGHGHQAEESWQTEALLVA